MGQLSESRSGTMSAVTQSSAWSWGLSSRGRCQWRIIRRSWPSRIVNKTAEFEKGKDTTHWLGSWRVLLHSRGRGRWQMDLCNSSINLVVWGWILLWDLGFATAKLRGPNSVLIYTPAIPLKPMELQKCNWEQNMSPWICVTVTGQNVYWSLSHEVVLTIVTNDSDQASGQ